MSLHTASRPESQYKNSPTYPGTTSPASDARSAVSYKQHVQFAGEVTERTLTESPEFSATDSMSPVGKEYDPAPVKVAVGHQGRINLMARLYDRPENSHALSMVRKQHSGNKPSGDVKSDMIPSPPSNKLKSPATAFRTTIFKRDYARRQLQRNPNKDNDSGPLPALNKLRRQGQATTFAGSRSPQLIKDNVGMESTKIVTDDVLSLAESDDSGTVLSDSGSCGDPKQKKTVTFDNQLTDDFQDEELEELAASPELSGRDDTSSRAGSTSRQDPAAVLTYLKKNIYDDEELVRCSVSPQVPAPNTLKSCEPANDDFLSTLLNMRRKLGWTVNLPRHGPGWREKMRALSDKPDEKEDLEGHIAAKDDTGKFVYALPYGREHRLRLNPYELQVVSAHTARSCSVYYTASASSVTRVEVDSDGEESSTRTSVLDWLAERRLYLLICDLPIFVKYRIWKSFTTWSLNVRGQKNNRSSTTLCRQLFSANEVLQGCLLHVRGLCEAASGSLNGVGVGQAAISLIDLNKNSTITLPDVMDMQEKQTEKAYHQLKALRKTVIDIVWESCATVAEMQGVTQGIRPASDKRACVTPEPKKPETPEPPRNRTKPKVKITLKSDVDKKKQPVKSGQPTYAQIAEWRKVLHRLSYFLRSIDYLMLELLRRLVITANRSLLQFVSSSYQAGMFDLEDELFSSLYSSSTSSLQETTTDSPEPMTLTTLRKLTDITDSKLSVNTEETSTGRENKAGRQLVEATYVPPKFDFSVQEEKELPPDIDQVLEEIEKQNEVIEVPKPIISLQLVLHTPQNLDSIGGWDSSKFNRRESRRKSVAKMVKFTDTEEAADTDSSASDEDEEDDNADDATSSGNRFAYSNGNDQEGYQGGIREDLSQSKKAYIALEPSEDTILTSFHLIITQFENTVAQMGSMLKEPRLAVFYSPPERDLKLNYDQIDEEEEDTVRWPDVARLFGEDTEYQKIITDLMDILSNTLDMVQDHAQDFEHYCTMVDRARRVDVEGSMQQCQWSTEEFQHVLAVHTEQVSDMKSMCRLRRVGLMDIYSEGFCLSCLPFPEKVVKAVCDQLPVIALKKNEDLLHIIKGASRKLDKPPSSVEEFVQHLSFLGKMVSEMPALEREYAVVIKLYTIAKDFELEIAPEEMALYQNLSPSFQHLKSIILYAEAKKEDNIRKYTSDLDRLISSIRDKITDIKNRVQDPVLLSGDTMAATALDRLSLLTEEVTELSTKARSYANYQERFGSSLTSQKKNFSEEYLLMDRHDENAAQDIQADLSEIERDLTLRHLLWESLEEEEKLAAEWTASAFDNLNVENLQKNVNRYTQTVYMLEKGLPHNEVVPRLKDKVMNFKQVMPCITSLRNPSLRARHWYQIEGIIGKAIEHDKSFTLGNLLEMKIIKHKDRIQDISTTASNEATLERMLQKVIDLWQSTDFRLVPHVSGSVAIIAGADDIMAQLEESQVTIGTIRGSRYVQPIKNTVEEWERKLTMFSRTLDEWMTCQRNWLYLEQIFTTPDIQRQLPSEYKMFSGVDKSWKDIMRRAEDHPNALRSATAPGVLELLQSSNASLDKIHKCLEDYLETKRLVFPRFYFLSNDELLDILAQSKNPEAVQPHLGKCFANIKSLDIKTLPRQPPTVKSISSVEGEIISMPKNVRARGPVEQWLGGVETGMFDTVKKHLKLGLQDWLGIGHEDWVIKHPGQVVLTVAQIMFNKDVMSCFIQSSARDALINLRDAMVKTLNTLAGLVSTNLLPHKRLSINALLTIDVHNRDILNSMIDNMITRKDDFEWTRQLRYEWDEQSNNCNALQSNASFVYGYEYLGCSPRLVITPLTDRCYLTLTGALHLHLGGSPAGPAGTGKTETVKDLAKAMGKQCVVFNCSEGLDYKMLGKFFSGLAQSGSWCCFDEFNRLDVEVLSVVAQQIHTIKAAKDQMLPRFMFEGKDIKLNISCGFFITMNPSYAGRVELPDNLKAFFRPVAMMVPDYALIAEIMLFSEGFTAAKSLSTKIVNLYQLASKQLSQQDHYDFGMRAIKSVLVMAGQKKRQFLLSSGGHEVSQLEESHLLIHSLRDANLPKFLAEDVPLFTSIMEDLFPDIIPPEPDQGAIEKAISMSIRDQGLQHWTGQTDKVKQLYNQLLVRHGVMLVGPTGGGKTTARNILQRALVLLPTIHSANDDDFTASAINAASQRRQSVFIHSRGKKGHVDTFTINPKCIKLGELYGATDPNTFEWSDGLIAMATRKFARESLLTQEDFARPPSSSFGSGTGGGTGWESSRPSSQATDHTSEVSSMPPDNAHAEAQSGSGDGEVDGVPSNWKWIVLDGPVDTMWVENLNTVLDDSKILCLANGERVALTSGMRLLFEVDDLSQASPATISRCAMVYMDPVDLGWRPYVRTWLQRLPRDMPDSGRQHLNLLFEHALDRGLEFVHHHSKHLLIPTPDHSFVMCLCNILAAFLDFMSKNGGFGIPDKETGRPGSADSESGTSHSSSRTGSRSDRRKRRGNKKANKLDDLETIDEKSKLIQSSGKQYYIHRNPSLLSVLLGKLFVFGYTWSIGGNFKRQDEVDDDGGITRRASDKRDYAEVDIATDFDNFVREIFEVEPPLGIRLPTSSRSIYSYFVDMDSGNFMLWDALVPTTHSLIEKGAVITIGESVGLGGGSGTSDSRHQRSSHDSDIVTTIDTVRYSFLAGLLLTNKNPVLLTGESGVGKTAIVNHLLKQLGKDGGTSFKSGTLLGSVFNFTDKNQALLENISSLTKLGGDPDDGDRSLDLMFGGGRVKQTTAIVSSVLQFSAQTSASRTQLALTQRLIKKGRDTLGAPKGKKVVVFLDDLNMPAPEEYGAQPPLELLRQFLELGGFYDTTKLVWKDILDVTPITACGPPGGGRNAISPRLLKYFCILALPQPSTRSLQHIYQVQLGRFFQEGEFMPEVKDCLFPLVSASIAVYYHMMQGMRPTPAKTHYTFNIRDLSQVISGLLQADEGVIVNSDNCAQLFTHEATRVFHDRLVDTADRTTFYQIISEILHDYFKVRWSAEQLQVEPVLFADFIDIQDGGLARVYKPVTDKLKLQQVLEEFYMRQNFSNTQATQMVFFKDAIEHILRAARVFRQPGGHMLLVGLDGTGKSSTVQLASHIAGCELYKLTLSRGYNIQDFRDDIKKVCLLAGVRGLNTAFLLTDGDIVKESFLEDINCILNSGEVPDLFDNEEVDRISMDLKAAAAEAQVPDTRQAVYQLFIQRVRKNLHIVLAMSPAGHKFRQRCRMNPSLVNCCTIDWFNEWDREAMLSVARMYFQNADFMCDDSEKYQVLQENVALTCVGIHDSVVLATHRFWQEVRRHYYVTPSSYMELIRTYSKLLDEKRSTFVNNRERLQVGLSRLSEAESLVGTMQDELVALGPEIEEKARDTEILLTQLEKDQLAVDQVREIVQAEEAEMQKETDIVQNYADECQQDLVSVIPQLQAAIESLDSLDKASISEIRVYTSPPRLVTMVIGAVCILLDKKPDWVTAKHVLADPQFLKKLINFDKNTVPEKVFVTLKKYSKHPDFDPKVVRSVSRACCSLCEWVLALEHYHEVYKMAKPKQRRVEEAKEALQLAQKKLAQKQASLAKIQEHLRRLHEQYEESVNQRESLKQRKVTTGLRLERASVLITALSGEKTRWADSIQDMSFKLTGIVGDTLVSSATVSYLGAFTTSYRKELMSQWIETCRTADIPMSQEYEYVKDMVDATQVLRWQNEGLPQDSLSTENAIIMKKGRRWPLLIDPQQQASKWIQEMEGLKLKVVQASDANYLRTVERAMRVGDAVLIQDVTETLDPSLKPILLQETFLRGGHQVMKIGDTEIEYNQNFRLYMTSSMGNPHFLPAVCIQVTLINFTVIFDGLQEQLLSTVVRQEKPELELERSNLLESLASDLQLLRELEDRSLSLLQEAQGHILDDQDLVETLERSKHMSHEIHERVSQSENAERSLNQARQRYLPVATRGAVLYFVLADLAIIDVMYQFSLTWFQNMFASCIDMAQTRPVSVASHHMSGRLRPSNMRRRSSVSTALSLGKDTTPRTPDMSETDLQAHMLKMTERLTSNIYRIVSVALFAHHQLMFSFLLCSSIMRARDQGQQGQPMLKEDQEGSIDKDEWTMFLQGNIMASMMTEEVKEKHDGLSPMQRLEYESREGRPERPRRVTEEAWKQCQYLEANYSAAFPMLCRSLVNTHPQWDTFFASENPYHLLQNKLDTAKYLGDDVPKEKVVFQWEDLSSFQRVLLIKILRPAMLTSSIHEFVKQEMGSQFVSSGNIDLKEMYEESNARTPLIFILSPGSDPLSQLLRFARELRGSTLHLDTISLGRGQGPKAEELISKAQILKGRWVFLQNCHLAASWMPKLQAIVENFNQPGSDVDPQFRLWLSSKPDASFPTSILQTGLKMTVEPPRGIKANLLRSFGTGGTGVVTERVYEEQCQDKSAAWKTLLFGLCFFNAVLHERKKYGRLGWNIPYEFNDSDLEVSVLQLQMLLTEQDTIPWPALWYLTGEVTFGGRVTDDWDRRCLHSMLQKFYQPQALKPDYYYTTDKVYHPGLAQKSFAEVKSYVEQLPIQDMPELCGMTDNAERTYLEAEARRLTDDVLAVQPQLTHTLAGSGRSSDEVVLELASNLLQTLPVTVETVTQESPRPGQPPRLKLHDLPQIATGTDPRVLQEKRREALANEMSSSRKEKDNGTTDPAVLQEIKTMCQSALFTVLRQELVRFDHLLSLVHRSLNGLILGVKGEMVMSESLEETYEALLKQRVPHHWKQASYESCKSLGSWSRDLIQRVDFFSEWADRTVSVGERILKASQSGLHKAASMSSSGLAVMGEDLPGRPASARPTDMFPRSYWLPAFVFPQGFLTAVLQNHARKLGVSVDSLTFQFTVTSKPDDTEDALNDIKQKLGVKQLAFQGNTPPGDGVLVFGLYLDGARWSLTDNALADSLPGQRFCHLPEIHFLPVVGSASSTSLESPLSMFKSQEALSPEPTVDHQAYDCPLYRTSSRAGTLSSTGHSTNFVTSVSLPSLQSPEFWVMRGVALLCQLDD